MYGLVTGLPGFNNSFSFWHLLSVSVRCQFFSFKMNIIEELDCQEIWTSFLETKAASGNMNKSQMEDFASFVQKREYASVVQKIKNGECFLPPSKVIISKQYTTKKRTVYIFSREENYVLKLLTYLLIRHYDHVFAKNLYSFRAGHGVKKAINYLRGDVHLSERYVYKVDIQNYFNSVDVKRLLPILSTVMNDAPETYGFIETLLSDSRAVLPNGEIITENRGIMAGAPISSFLANLYLYQLDWFFFNNGNKYARYSDDIIIFARNEAERQENISYIYSFLEKMSLTVNKDKEFIADPHECWDFLGFSYCDGVFDISEISANKLKKKMWRKSRALLRWKSRKQIDNIYAAKAFVKSFNKKLYDNSITKELTWTRWYFPIINTTQTLSMLDHYMQDCVRYIVTEKRTNKRYNFTYEKIKELGYKSLTHEYYKVMDKVNLPDL